MPACLLTNAIVRFPCRIILIPATFPRSLHSQPSRWWWWWCSQFNVDFPWPPIITSSMGAERILSDNFCELLAGIACNQRWLHSLPRNGTDLHRSPFLQFPRHPHSIEKSSLSTIYGKLTFSIRRQLAINNALVFRLKHWHSICPTNRKET